SLFCSSVNGGKLPKSTARLTVFLLITSSLRSVGLGGPASHHAYNPTHFMLPASLMGYALLHPSYDLVLSCCAQSQHPVASSVDSAMPLRAPQNDGAQRNPSFIHRQL